MDDDEYYMKSDYPIILTLVFIMVVVAFHTATNNFKLSIIFTSIIYLVIYTFYNIFKAIW